MSAAARLDDLLVALSREFHGAGVTIRWAGKPDGSGQAWVNVSCNGIMGAGETVGEAVQAMLPEIVLDAQRRKSAQDRRLARVVELTQATFPREPR